MPYTFEGAELATDNDGYMLEAHLRDAVCPVIVGPAKQGAKVAGLPQPYGRGGY